MKMSPIKISQDQIVLNCAIEVSSSFVQSRGTSEYASVNGEVLDVLKQLLEEMNSDIAAVEAPELEHKKTFDELSDAKNEDIAASSRRHKEKSLEERKTTLSNDRNTAEMEMTQESLGEQEALLANLGQLDICEIQIIAEIIEILHENENQACDHFSTTNTSSLLQPTCRAFPQWLERRAELEENIVELDAARIAAKTLAIQLKR